MNKKNYFVADEGDNIYNAFAFDMFDKDGYLEGHNGEQGYHLSDYDIVKKFATWTQAVEYCEMLNEES